MHAEVATENVTFFMLFTGLIAMVIIGALVIVGLVLLINPSTRKAALKFGAFVLLVIVGLPALYLLQFKHASYNISQPPEISYQPSPQIPAQHASALPEWANKSPHWEGDAYVVPLTTPFSTRDSGGQHGDWEQEMDRAAAIELEQVVRGALQADSSANFGGNSQAVFRGQYDEIKHRICGPERHLEAVKGTATEAHNYAQMPTRYRMHGLLRFDPVAREQLREEFARIWQVKLVWQSPPAIEVVAATAAASAAEGHNHTGHDEIPVPSTAEAPDDHGHSEHEAATTPAADAATAVEAMISEVAAAAEAKEKQANAPTDAEKPAWVDQPPHWEGDTYVVPVASGFNNTKPVKKDSTFWEGKMDKAAIEAIQPAIREIIPSRRDRKITGSGWAGMYRSVKYKIWSAERYVEVAKISISEKPAYQLHGVMRITPEVRKMLESQLPVLLDSARAASAGGAVAIAEVRPRFSFDYLFINPVLILLLAAVIALIAHPRTRRGTLIGLVGLALIAPLLLWPYLQKVKRDVEAREHTERLHAVQAADEDRARKPITTTASDAESNKSKEGGIVAKPPWIDQPARLEGSIYRAPVKSGLFVTDQECDKDLRAKVAATVDQYVDDLFGELTSQKLRRELEPRQYVKETYRETVTSSSVGPMRQAHVLVQFDDQARALMVQRWQELLASERLSRMALITASVLGLLAIVFAYLKFDLRTGGQIRGRLRFAAVGAIIVLATTVAAVCHAFEL